MAKFLYGAAMSLDGFIAGADGDMSWLTEYLGPNPLIDQLIPRIGALLVGRTTYGGDDPHKGQEGEGKAFGGGWSGPQFVLTHRPPAVPEPDVTFVTDFDSAVRASAAAAAGDGYVNVLGASVARQCLDAGVLDEVLMSVVPVLLGDGTRVFDHPGGRTVRLERLAVDTTGSITSVLARVLPSS